MRRRLDHGNEGPGVRGGSQAGDVRTPQANGALIIEAAPERHQVLFALLAATGLRMGATAGLHLEDVDLDNGVVYVRRSVWNGQEFEPKTETAVREIDIDPALAALLRDYIGSSRRIRLFEARNGAPLSAGNIRNRVMHPLLRNDLQKLWIGHSNANEHSE